MMLRRSPTLMVLTLVGVISSGGAAQADVSAEEAAQVLFDEGMRLMEAGRVAEACPRLEESQRLDPGMGTEFRLAECYEKTGRLLKAFALFNDVAAAAKAAKSRERAEFASKRAKALEPRLPRLVVMVPAEVASVAGLEILLDGERIERSRWGVAVPVDPGSHTVRVMAPGKKAWEGRVGVSEGAALDVRISPLEAEASPIVLQRVQIPPQSAPVALKSAPPSSLLPPLVLAGLALTGVAIGVPALLAANSKRTDARELMVKISPGSSSGCITAREHSSCAELSSAWSDAAMFENLAFWSFVGAGVAAAGMTAYLLWPKAAPARLAIGPAFGASSGVVISGRF